MAKKALPKLADWHAPWEVNAEGEEIPEGEQEVDTGVLRRYLHNLLRDKERLQSRAETLTTERDELSEQLENAGDGSERPEAEVVKELRTEIKTLKKDAGKKAGPSIRELKLEVGIERGLTMRQALRLVGDTLDDLEEDADVLVEELGLDKDSADKTTGRKGADTDDDDGDDSGDSGPRTATGRPRRLRNPSDPKERNEKPTGTDVGNAEADRRFGKPAEQAVVPVAVVR